jgi:hypothetical protein
LGALSERRRFTEERIAILRRELIDAAELAHGKACVYATGSFGRLEASKHSDLDLFIVGSCASSNGVQAQKSCLNRLNEILIKADLIKATRALGIRDFSGEGKYLVHYSVAELTETLGKPDDDATNTFTARLLLLLESSPLLEEDVYRDVKAKVIEAYWRDYPDHRNNFMPAFLANDILRLWRTFCVNYEANSETEPPEAKAERKLNNYKLKHSRLLTCYSALLYLLAVYRRSGTVSPDDALAMIALSPTARLEWLLAQHDLEEAIQSVGKVLSQYEAFLAATNATKKELLDVFLDKTQSRPYVKSAFDLGDYMFQALSCIGKDDRFYRLLVV